MPSIIIAAQPSRGLDVGAVETVHRLLLERRTAGAAVLLISEDLDEILALSDRVAVIYEGHIAGVLDVADADIHTLGLLMTGSDLRTRGPDRVTATTRRPLIPWSVRTERRLRHAHDGCRSQRPSVPWRWPWSSPGCSSRSSAVTPSTSARHILRVVVRQRRACSRTRWSRRPRSSSPASPAPWRSGCASGTSAPRGSCSWVPGVPRRWSSCRSCPPDSSPFVLIPAMLVAGIAAGALWGGRRRLAEGTLQRQRDHHHPDAQLHRHPVGPVLGLRALERGRLPAVGTVPSRSLAATADRLRGCHPRPRGPDHAPRLRHRPGVRVPGLVPAQADPQGLRDPAHRRQPAGGPICGHQHRSQRHPGDAHVGRAGRPRGHVRGHRHRPPAPGRHLGGLRLHGRDHRLPRPVQPVRRGHRVDPVRGPHPRRSPDPAGRHPGHDPGHRPVLRHLQRHPGAQPRACWCVGELRDHPRARASQAAPSCCSRPSARSSRSARGSSTWASRA